MKIVTKLFVTCFILMFAISVAYTQNRPTSGTVGLSASIQSSQSNLQLPIWLNENTSIASVFGINYQQNNFTSLNLGVASRFYQSLGNDLGTYIGARGIIRHTSPETGPDDTDLLIGPIGGGEYFLSSHFSLGVEGQLNILLNDNGNNSISTGAAIIGSFYF